MDILFILDSWDPPDYPDHFTIDFTFFSQVKVLLDSCNWYHRLWLNFLRIREMEISEWIFMNFLIQASFLAKHSLQMMVKK